MSLKKVHSEQPKNFEFNVQFKSIAEEILKKYPKKNKKSAVMPFLYLAQKDWLRLNRSSGRSYPFSKRTTLNRTRLGARFNESVKYWK